MRPRIKNGCLTRLAELISLYHDKAIQFQCLYIFDIQFEYQGQRHLFSIYYSNLNLYGRIDNDMANSETHLSSHANPNVEIHDD